MSLQDLTPPESTESFAQQPLVMLPLPYFPGPLGRPPLAVRLIRLFGVTIGAMEILNLLVLMFLPGYRMSKYFSFASRHGYSPGLSLVVETVLSAFLLAASITAYSNRRLGKIGLLLWAWTTVMWIAYCLVARTAYQLYMPMRSMAYIGVATLVLEQGIRDAVFPVLTLAVLRMSEIRAYFDAGKGQPG